MTDAALSSARRRQELLVSVWPIAWLAALFVLPTLLVFAIAFRPSDPFGGIGEGYTLDTVRSLSNPNYPAIIWRTLWLSFAATVVCVMLAIPSGYCIARTQRRWKRILLLLVIVPFWTSSLVRIFAWKILLHPEGFVKRIFCALGLVSEQGLLLYNSWSVLLVLIYTSLPFAVLPVYAAAEKFDYRLIEAARDLGARQIQAFFRVFVPGISRGVWTALLVVFIPSLGSYVIPDIVGGPQSEMIGNKIAQRTFVDRNLPQASALSACLTLAVFLPLIGVLSVRGRREREPQTVMKEDV